MSVSDISGPPNLVPSSKNQKKGGGPVNQHPPAHHPLDARGYSLVDEPQQLDEPQLW
jgi:hypothetical protein